MSPKYQIDGFYMRNFGILPTGEKLENLDDFLKLFYMYVIAFAPSIDTMTHYANYMYELKEAENRDYSKDIKQTQEMLEVAAKYANMSVDEYIKQLCNGMKEKAIRSVKDKYNMLTEEEQKAIEEQKSKLDKMLTEFIQDKHYGKI